MPRFRFLKTVYDGKGRELTEGKTYDLHPASGRHWIDRHVAVPIKDGKTEDAVAKPEGVAEAPEGGGDESRARAHVLDERPAVSAPDAMTSADLAPKREPSEPDEIADQDDGLDGKSRPELLTLVDERGLDLGPGYKSKEALIEALRSAGR